MRPPIISNGDIVGFSGIEHHAWPFVPEPLDGRLVLGRTGHQRGDDVAVVGRLLRLHHHEVAVEDPRLDHRVAQHPQREVVAARQ